MKRVPAIFFFLILMTGLAPAQSSAVGGVVNGNVQKVGFRGFVLRQAISQNLGGWVVNLADGRVSFALYGNPERIAQALAVIEKGPEKSAVAGVKTWNLPKQSGSANFTVYGWTSESRDLHTPRDLVFFRRPDDSLLDEHDTKKAYHKILKAAGVEDP